MKYLANLFSFANGAAGIASIYATIQGDLSLGIRLILLGFFFDAIDGACARAFGSVSWGSMLDRTSDRITQALAPAFLLVVYSRIDIFLTIGAIIFITFAFKALRGKEHKEYFSGLPLTVPGFVIMGEIMIGAHLPSVLLLFLMACSSLPLLRYPRRLSRPHTDESDVRTPLLGMKHIAGRTWIARAAFLLVLVFLPQDMWPALGIVLIAGACAYAFTGPFLYKKITAS